MVLGDGRHSDLDLARVLEALSRQQKSATIGDFDQGGNVKQRYKIAEQQPKGQCCKMIGMGHKRRGGIVLFGVMERPRLRLSIAEDLSTAFEYLDR